MFNLLWNSLIIEIIDNYFDFNFLKVKFILETIKKNYFKLNLSNLNLHIFIRFNKKELNNKNYFWLIIKNNIYNTS